MKVYPIKLKPDQVNILKEFLKEKIKSGLPRNDEWHSDYKILHDLHLRFNHYCKDGILSIDREKIYAILNFISEYINDGIDSWTASIHYRHVKLFHELWFQSINKSSTDPEDWKWFIKNFTPDHNTYINYRKW